MGVPTNVTSIAGSSSFLGRGKTAIFILREISLIGGFTHLLGWNPHIACKWSFITFNLFFFAH